MQVVANNSNSFTHPPPEQRTTMPQLIFLAVARFFAVVKFFLIWVGAAARVMLRRCFMQQPPFDNFCYDPTVLTREQAQALVADAIARANDDWDRMQEGTLAHDSSDDEAYESESPQIIFSPLQLAAR